MLPFHHRHKPLDLIVSPVPKRPRRGHGRPTLHDVAEAAGVTRITVSRYVREAHRVAPDTAARIEAAIRETGYVPNHQAGQLASGASRLVAALIPNVGHSIFAETIQGLAEGLRGSGHELLLFATGYSLDREEAQLRALLGWAPGALIVTGRRHTGPALQMLRDAGRAGTPVVEIWDHAAEAVPDPGIARIGFDHLAVGRDMAGHLLDQGHTALAYVDSGVAEDYRAHDRGQGFVAEVEARGGTVTLLRAATGDAFDAGREVLGTLLGRSGPPVTAAAFANDHLACGALMQAQDDRIAVPERLALLGFGDFPIGAQLRPGLSTVRPPRAAIGRAAAAAVLASMAERGAPESALLPCDLIVRGSTVAPGRARAAG